LPLTVLENAEWEQGMASSVRLAARWAASVDLDGLLLLVCDQPRLGSAQLERLMLAFRGGETVIASFYAGVPGVPALFPRALFRELAELQGDIGARSLLRRASSRVLVPWPDGAIDIDTPEQLSGALAAR
jgi:molybdenum cofactor cytidylyltransferase